MHVTAEAIFYALDHPPYQAQLMPSPSIRAKRLSLRVDNKTHTIKLVIPKAARLHHIINFVERHEGWINARIAEFPQKVPLENGAVIPLFGKERLITLAPPMDGQHGRTTHIDLQDERLMIHTTRPDPSGNIRKWLKDEARATLTNLSREKAAMIGKEVQSVSVRDTATRWGSCSHDGRISYSWRLIFCPFDVIDYVAAHEVAHLQHMDHSRNFWKVCKDLSDNMDFGRKWLKTNGNSLMRYG